MSTSPFTPLTLNGVSKYSSDLQSVLNRAAQIAQIPVTALQNRDSDVLQKVQLLGGFRSSVADLASSLQSLGTIAANQAVGATSSDPSVVTVTNSGTATPATYTINSVTSVAAAASETSLTGYADSAATPVSANGTMQLVVGSQKYTFTLTNNNLVTLRDKVNSLGAGVTASILTTSSGNYLSVSANGTGATTLQLIDDPKGAKTAWLTNKNQGSDAVFHLNGILNDEPGNVINDVIPGVTFTLQGATDTPVTLSLRSDRTQLESALQDFATKYNAVRTALNAQEGPAAGMLSGDLTITQTEDAMRQIAAYQSSTGSVRSLSDLGIGFDTAGQASFDQTAFDQLSDSQLKDAFKFIGSATAGLGGIGGNLTQLSDPISGLIKTEETGLSNTDKSLQQQITTLTDRITTMQKNLASRLQAADALLASLESQQQTLNASLQGLDLVLFGKNTQNS